MTSEPVAILEADENEAVVAIATITAASVGAYGVPARVSAEVVWG
jgi:hypothetical protein